MDPDALHKHITNAVQEGQRTLPEKPDRAPLICKPRKIESWRLFRIMAEFVEGFDILRKYGLAVTFFGSARTAPDSHTYTQVYELSQKLSKHGFAIISGGSLGVMQAANKGAFEAGGSSVGLNIQLPNEQHYNPYLTDQYTFDHFFVRKVMLAYASEVYVYFPGGFGTLDEFFELLTLIQTGKIRKVPIILVGKDYWEPLLEFIAKTVYADRQAIDKKDMELYQVVDTVDEAYEYIVANVSC